MDEFALIDRFFRRAVDEDVVLGIGDDAAVINVPEGRLLVAAVDTQVDSVHFPGELAASDIGYRAVATNLSDLAAMGATPRWMTLALSLPATDEHWLADFAAGLFTAADEHGVALVGGDTTQSSQTVISVQLMGHVDAKTVLRRDACQPGDRIYVTGTPGDAAAGLDLIQQGQGEAGYLQQRFRRPSARVSFGQRAAPHIHAAIDISDGLAADLGHILSASGIAAMIDADALPLSPALIEFAGGDKGLAYALTGGDDYELCLTASPAQEQALMVAARECGVSLTRIGVAGAGDGLRVMQGDKQFEYGDDGYRHF